MVSWVSPSFFCPERLHWCYIYFHCSYLYGYKNSSGTLSIKCCISYWDLIKFPYFTDTTKRSVRGWKEVQRQGEFADFSNVSVSAGNENREGGSAEITAAEQCEWNIPAWHLDCFGWCKWSWENNADGCSCWPQNGRSHCWWYPHLWISKVSENFCSDLWVLWAKWYSFPPGYGYGIPCVFSLASTGCRDWLYTKDGTSSWYHHGIKPQSCFYLQIPKKKSLLLLITNLDFMMITFHQFPRPTPSLLSHRSTYLQHLQLCSVCDPAQKFLTSDFCYLLFFQPHPYN